MIPRKGGGGTAFSTLDSLSDEREEHKNKRALMLTGLNAGCRTEKKRLRRGHSKKLISKIPLTAQPRQKGDAGTTPKHVRQRHNRSQQSLMGSMATEPFGGGNASRT